MDCGNRKALGCIAEGSVNYNEESNGSENLTIVSSFQDGAQESVVSEFRKSKRCEKRYKKLYNCTMKIQWGRTSATCNRRKQYFCLSTYLLN